VRRTRYGVVKRFRTAPGIVTTPLGQGCAPTPLGELLPVGSRHRARRLRFSPVARRRMGGHTQQGAGSKARRSRVSQPAATGGTRALPAESTRLTRFRSAVLSRPSQIRWGRDARPAGRTVGVDKGRGASHGAPISAPGGKMRIPLPRGWSERGAGRIRSGRVYGEGTRAPQRQARCLTPRACRERINEHRFHSDLARRDPR
jgi:hypothetical protein